MSPLQRPLGQLSSSAVCTSLESNEGLLGDSDVAARDNDSSHLHPPATAKDPTRHATRPVLVYITRRNPHNYNYAGK